MPRRGKFSLATPHRGEVSNLMQNNHESELLVTTDWLAAHLDDLDVHVVDTRKGDGYEVAHVPGAVRYPAPITPFFKENGRVPSAEKFAGLMSEIGVGDENLVVAYDDGNNLFAARLWWALNYYGHDQVVVLNGGLPKWQLENLPLESAIPVYPPAVFTPVVQPQLRATAEEVVALLGQQGVAVVDARERGQYTGETVRGTGRRGHISGALNIPREELVDPETGTFRSNEELERVFSSANVSPEQRVVAYCNGGVAATTVLFSLAMLGYPQLTNDDGSWNAWGKRRDVPTEL